MTVTSTPSRSRWQTPSRTHGPVAVVGTLVGAAVLASLLDALVAVIAHGAGVGHHFKPLETSSYVSLTVVGIAIGGAGWAIVRSRASNPARTLSRLVPIVLILSLIPDVGVGFSKSMADTGWGGAAALMVMHVLVAAVAVGAYLYSMPVTPDAAGE